MPAPGSAPRVRRMASPASNAFAEPSTTTTSGWGASMSSPMTVNPANASLTSDPARARTAVDARAWGQTAVLAKEEALAVAVRALSKCVTEHLAVVARRGVLVCDLDPLRRGHGAARAPEPVDRSVARHAQDPRSEAGPPHVVLRERRHQLEEDLLGDVGCVVAVTDDAADVRVDRTGVARVEVAEPGGVTVEDLLDRDCGAPPLRGGVDDRARVLEGRRDAGRL